MLDLKLVRVNPGIILKALVDRQVDPESLQLFFELEEKRRRLLVPLEQMRHKLKEKSRAFGQQKERESNPPLELKQLSDQVKQQERELRVIEEEIDKEMSVLPNIPHESVPVGGPEAKRVVRSAGDTPTFPFAPRTHLELGERLGILDFPRAAKIAGSHFSLFTGKGARLERALINWMLDVQTQEHGYTEVWPPLLVNRAAMFGTGQLPKFEEDMYRLKDDDLFLVPTAEVPLINLHRDETLEEGDLPLAYAAYTPCFRREAGSYGKETRGLIRVHQFDKVELVRFATPETSYDELERLLGHAETILGRLGLQYRVVCLSTSELGFAAAKCYDLEAWAPGLRQFLEVSSCSNVEAFQARRANIRYRQAATKKMAYVHTLNGSGVALARTMICLLETHQQADGHVVIPEPLRPYVDGQGRL
jgi:seryl-tRNA synthetase